MKKHHNDNFFQYCAALVSCAVIMCTSDKKSVRTPCPENNVQTQDIQILVVFFRRNIQI